MKITKFLLALMASISFLVSANVFADEHSINAQAREYKPDMVYMPLGDTVNFQNMTSHNSVTYVKPEGSAGWGEHGVLPGGSLSVTPDKEGIYGYVCEPHIGFGMAGVVVVGNVTQEMKDAAMADAMKLQGPFRRLIGKIKKVEVK